MELPKKLPRRMSASWTISPLAQPLEGDTYQAKKITAQNEPYLNHILQYNISKVIL